MSSAEPLLRRLDDVSERLAAHAADHAAVEALTTPDPATGERWDVGQVWAHLAEFIPYWIDQVQRVTTSYDGEPVPFGRTKADEGRVAAIDRERAQPVTVLWAETHGGIEQLRGFLRGLDATTWQARGLHPTLGPMGMERILEEFLVGHLEEHAGQLEELARVPPPGH